MGSSQVVSHTGFPTGLSLKKGATNPLNSLALIRAAHTSFGQTQGAKHFVLFLLVKRYTHDRSLVLYSS